MNQAEVLRKSFSEFNITALRELWATEARVEWAENVLREELLARGVSSAELDDVASRRQEIAESAPPSARDTLWKYGFVGRAVALVSAMVSFFLFNSLFGTRVGAYAMAIVFAFYVLVLIRRVFFQSQFRVSGGASFAMTWQCIEAVLVLLVFIFLAVTLPSHA